MLFHVFIEVQTIAGRPTIRSEHLSVGDIFVSRAGPSEQMLEGIGRLLPLCFPGWLWHGGAPACAIAVDVPIQRAIQAPWSRTTKVRTEARTLTTTLMVAQGEKFRQPGVHAVGLFLSELPAGQGYETLDA